MLRLALIGCGIFTKETYIPNINIHADRVQLTAILSRSEGPISEALSLLNDASNVKKFVGTEGEVDFFESAKDICDAVVIAVPIPLLGVYVEKCLAIGMPVLSEKPVAMNSTEAQRLIEFNNQLPHRGLWHVAENYRFEPAFRYASGLIKEKVLLPKSFALTALRQQSPTAKYAVTTWRKTPEYVGSYVLDGGIHFVAMLRFLLPGPVRDIASIYQENSVVEVGACGSCRVGDALGTFHIRYGAYLEPVCRLDIYWDDAAMTITQIRGVGYEVVMTGREPQRFGFGGIQAEFVAWLDALSEHSIVPELSPEEGLKDLLVIEQMCSQRLF